MVHTVLKAVIHHAQIIACAADTSHNKVDQILGYMIYYIRRHLTIYIRVQKSSEEATSTTLAQIFKNLAGCLPVELTGGPLRWQGRLGSAEQGLGLAEKKRESQPFLQATSILAR